MAAPSEDAVKKCEICLGLIKGRTYRSFTSETSLIQWGPTLSELNIKLTGVGCYHCTNKLNKICQSETKVESVLMEKNRIIESLKEMPGIKGRQVQDKSTPKDSRKRPIHVAVTPNTVTPKSKKSLFVTPKSATPKILYKRPCLKAQGTQTIVYKKDFHVKVTVKYQGQERAYSITDKNEQKLIKSLINKGTASAVGKHLAKVPQYKAAMTDCVTKEVMREVDQLVKRRETLLRVLHSDALLNFDWKTTYSLLQEKAPTLMSVLRGVVSDKKKKCLPYLVMAAGILLYGRNQTMNQIQFILGLVLDSGGLKKEVLNIMHDIGLSVSYTSVCNNRKELIKTQEENIDKVVKSYITKQCQKQQPVNTHSMEVVSSMDTCMPAETSPVETQPSDFVEQLVRPKEISPPLENRLMTVNTIQAGEKTNEESVTPILPNNTSYQCNTMVKNEYPSTEHEAVQTGEQSVVTSLGGTSTETQTFHSVSDQTLLPEIESDTEHDKVKVKPIEVLGDNLDITVAPAKMTMECQRKSLHWFLTMVKQRQVTFEDAGMETDAPEQPDVLTLPSSRWVPDPSHIEDLQKDMLFHVVHVLLKYIEPLKPLSSSYPEHILHPFMELTKQKSVILNCDLVDASENTSQGMIEILQKVHSLAVPQVDGKVVEKVVFGGDVLTNERAFSAQAAMQNNQTDTDKLTGVIHRPEGLHRQFNFLLVILPNFRSQFAVGCFVKNHIPVVL